MHDTWVTESTLKYPKEMFKNTVKHSAAVQQSCWIFYKCIQKLILSSNSFKNANNFLIHVFKKTKQTNKQKTAKTLKQLKYKKIALDQPGNKLK